MDCLYRQFCESYFLGGSDTEFILISEDGTQFMRSDLGTLEGPYDIDQLFDSPIPMETIGAARRVNGYNQPQPYRFQFYDKSGFQNVLYNPFTNSWGNVNTGATVPFDAVGIGAMTYKSTTASDMYYFNRDGDKWAFYVSNTPSASRDLWKWGEGVGSTQADPILTFNVGAATSYTSTAGNISDILFDKGGTRYVVYGKGFGTVTTNNPNGVGAIGPFDL